MKVISKRRTYLSPPDLAQDDRILPEARWLAVFIIPFLVAAFILLYFWPNDTDKLFAWTIKPAMTPMMLTAACSGGIYFFTRAPLVKQVAPGETGLPAGDDLRVVAGDCHHPPLRSFQSQSHLVLHLGGTLFHYALSRLCCLGA